MNILTFDTETITIGKPFCYNIGYTIFNTDTKEKLLSRDFVVSEIWNNKELFETAYYAEKRPIYTSYMKGKRTKKLSFEKICEILSADIEENGIEYAYAYNSPFDDRVFQFNCEWFKVDNPFEYITILDIRGLVHNCIAFTEEFQDFCEKNEYFTEAMNYSTTAETLFRFISKDLTFAEEHTALSDSIIETDILIECVNRGCEYGKEYKVYSSIPRKTPKLLQIVDKISCEVIFETDYLKLREKKDKSGMKITLDR